VPADLLLLLDHLQGPPERVHRGHVPLGEPQGHAVQEEIDRPRRLRARRRGPGGLSDLRHARVTAETAGEDGGPERIDVRLPSQFGIQWFEPPRRLEQQRRSIAPVPADEGDLSPQPDELGAVELIERAQVRRGEQGGGIVGRAGIELRLGGGESPRSSPDRIRGELGRSLQERGGRRHTAPGLRSRRAAFQLSRHRFVGSCGRVGTMPGPAVRIDDRIGRVGQRPMRFPALGHRRRPVHGRAHQRMPEPDPRPQHDQARGLGRGGGIPGDPQLLGRTPQEGHVADRLGRGRKQERLRLRRQ
jgi:hypothetical protein